MIEKNIILSPFRSLKQYIIGVILFVLSDLIIPPIFAFGYMIRLYQNAEVGKPNLPEWKNWIDLGRLGLFGVLIAIIYLIPAAILFLISTALFTLKINLIGYAFALLAILIGLVGLFILPASLYLYSKEERFSDALDTTKVFESVKKNLSGHTLNLVLLFVINLPFFILNFALREFVGKSTMLDVSIAILFALSQFFILCVMALSFGMLYSGVKRTAATPSVATESNLSKLKEAKFCPNCGAKISKGAKFCNSCGIKLNN